MSPEWRTLMKGDRIIDLLKEIAYLSLLFVRWMGNQNLFHSFNIDAFAIANSIDIWFQQDVDESV